MRKSRRQPALFLRELITARSQRLKTARLSWVGALPHGRQMPALAHAVNNSCFDMQEGEMIRGILSFASFRGFHVGACGGPFGRAGASARFVVGRSDLEATIGQIMDYLVERDDVDEHRIAILADGWSSSFVARGIAFDDRFAAAVCDGGIWDLNERAFLRDLVAPSDANALSRPVFSRVARNIKCPVLISTGERGWLKAERVKELYDGLKADGRDVTLKIFTSEETGSTRTCRQHRACQ